MHKVQNWTKSSKIQWTLDPLNRYPEIQPTYLAHMHGLIPSFMDGDNPAPLKTQLDEGYSWGLFEMEGGSLSDLGVYSYPEDPDLYPLGMFERVQDDGTYERVYMYQYGIVAIVDLRKEDDKLKVVSTFVTRMD